MHGWKRALDLHPDRNNRIENLSFSHSRQPCQPVPGKHRLPMTPTTNRKPSVPAHRMTRQNSGPTMIKATFSFVGDDAIVTPSKIVIASSLGPGDPGERSQRCEAEMVTLFGCSVITAWTSAISLSGNPRLSWRIFPSDSSQRISSTSQKSAPIPPTFSSTPLKLSSTPNIYSTCPRTSSGTKSAWHPSSSKLSW